MKIKNALKTFFASFLSMGLIVSPAMTFAQENEFDYAPISSDPYAIYGNDFVIETDDEGIRLENILGEDTRTVVENTTEYPYSAICKLIIRFVHNGVPRTFIGTGFFIGDNQILTAAHCIYDKAYGGMISSIEVYPASDSQGNLPYGSFKVTPQNVHVTSKWISSQPLDEDFGLIVLDQAVGKKTGTLSLSANPTENLEQEVMIAGYPYQAGDKLSTLAPKKGYGRFESLNSSRSRIMYHAVDTQPGQSGSPILNANNEVIGIHTFGLTNYLSNGGVLIDDYVRNTISDWTSSGSMIPEENDNTQRQPSIVDPVYRVYNPQSTEHFYTPSLEEAKNTINHGWNDEGIAWNNEKASEGVPLYRVFNPVAGDHHYTLSKNEVQDLVKLGWNDEGIAWYASSNDSDIPVYRLYNPNAKTGTHHFTYNYNECLKMIQDGWKYEGIAFYTR